MRVRTRHMAKGMTFGAVAGLSWLVAPPDAGAQTALCPSVVVPPDNVRVTFPESQSFVPTRNDGYVATNGFCSNDASAFSGAALASQALSELSQSTTQETTRTSTTAIVERREAERERCAEGFRRVDGVCEPIAPRPPARVEAVPPARAEPAAPEKPAKRKPKPAKVTPVAEAREPVRVVKGYPEEAPPPPLVVAPEARFGAWTQVIGDYERRNASGSATIPGLTPLTGGFFSAPDRQLVNVPLALNVSSRSGTIGFQAGADVTSRGVLAPDDGVIIGGFGGYVSTDLTLNSFAASSNPSVVGNSTSSLRAKLSGATAGLYATYFNGPFSTDFLLKLDALTLNESFTDSLAFTPGPLDRFSIAGPFNSGFANSASTTLLNGTIAGNFNYRFLLYPNLWVEPTVGAQYTNTSYGANANLLGLDDGSLVMVQGGARFGTSTLIDNKVLVTTTLTGLAYSNVLVAGGFIPGVGFAGGNILAQADEGQVRGRGVVAFNLDFGNGVKSFIQGEARGGQGLFGAGGKAGVRVEW